uniref:Type I polyketide synthase n=1 Tax=Gambierdiscus polynesiensis TaxID=439318 RepID=A0A1S6K863_9DINO|nr:type I polyketide synthase [Gambierdiscus polynesiensis]
MSASNYLRRPGRTSKPTSDVRPGPPEGLGPGIVECLRVKGYCVLTDVVSPNDLDAAQGAIPNVDTWVQPAGLVQDGLLGDEGSSRIIRLEQTNREMKPPSGSGFPGIDFLMWQLLEGLTAPLREELGFSGCQRDETILHEAALSEWDNMDLEDEEAERWCNTFISHKVIIMLFLGPKRGVVELQPFDPDADSIEVTTEPGMAVVARTDELSFRFYSKGHEPTYAATCFIRQPHILLMRRKKMLEHMVPAAEQLDTYRMNRMREIKETEEQEDDESVPRKWVADGNRMFFKQELINVRSASCRLASDWDWETTQLAVLRGGTDTVLTVPLQRWDHNVYFRQEGDSDAGFPKTNCRHGAFMDGYDLLDNWKFKLTVTESEAMDPAQKQALEVAYEAMHQAGYKKTPGASYPIGMFVGQGTSEWYHADRRPAEIPGMFSLTSWSSSITAGRLSFLLNCKGPSLSIDTDQASSLTAVFQASDAISRKGRFTPSTAACAIGAHLVLASVIWLARSQSGSFSNTGRCFTFGDNADGLVVADGVGCGLLKPRMEIVDEEEIIDCDSVGTIVGSASNNSGGRASNLRAPHGTSLQELLLEAIEASGIQPADLDIMECHGPSNCTGDYIEVMSMVSVMRAQPEDQGSMLQASCSKSNVGNSISMAGLSGLIKTMLCIRWGIVMPNVHLKCLNSRVDLGDPRCQSLSIATELLEQGLGNIDTNVFAGVTAFGWGGTNIHIQCFGNPDEGPRPEAEAWQDEPKSRLLYWPAGGGDIDIDRRPRKGYFIIGTFNEWKEGVHMHSEGDGCHGYTLTLGENRWEQFQILIDGNTSKVMHPGQYKAPKGTKVYGPDDLEGIHEVTWLLDARGKEGHSPAGRMGDRYRVRIHVAGKWMVVTWTKLEDAITPTPAVPLPAATYCLRGSWDDYEGMLAMDPVAATPGVYSAQVTLRGRGGSFIIFRNDDPAQAIYPARPNSPWNEAILGPDDPMEGLEWCLFGRAGDCFKIEFRRTLEDDADTMKLKWHKL